MIFKSKRRRYNSVKNGRNNNTETILCILEFTATLHVKEIFSECQFVNR